MKARVCDKCGKVIRGPYLKVISVGGNLGKVLDLCPVCFSRLLSMEAHKHPNPKPKEAPKTRRLYDVPLDDSPIKVHEVSDTATLSMDRAGKDVLPL